MSDQHGEAKCVTGEDEWKVTPGYPPAMADPYAMTADQQIRAKALECAVHQMRNMGKDTPNKYADALWSLVATFETYIRESK